MYVVDFSTQLPPAGGIARFKGADHDASVSAFIVNCPPGMGADRHRHPYLVNIHPTPRMVQEDA